VCGRCSFINCSKRVCLTLVVPLLSSCRCDFSCMPVTFGVPTDSHLLICFLLQAVAAAIDLRQYRPTTITFGSPRPISLQDNAPCNDFLAEKHYRFINANEKAYDNVPFGTTSGSSMRGHTFLLDGFDFPIGYPGLNNDLTRNPQDAVLHPLLNYGTRILNIMEGGECAKSLWLGRVACRT
jgi:hypothetical protein